MFPMFPYAPVPQKKYRVVRKTQMSAIAITKMSPNHFDACVGIERTSDENFWTKATFEAHLSRRYHGGLVAMQGFAVVGFLAYELNLRKGEIQIWNLVVTPGQRRVGVAATLIAELKKMIGCEFASLQFNVRESNLPVQVLLRKMEFRCTAIARSYFIDIDHRTEGERQEDAYCFVYHSERENKDVTFLITDRCGGPVAELRSGTRTRCPVLERAGRRQG